MTRSPTPSRTLRLTALAALLGAAAFLTVPAFAQDETATSPPTLPGGIAFSAIDTDGDGVISAEEWAAFVEARRAMTPEERRAARTLAMAERIVAELDTDGDGLLSAEELAAMPALMRARMDTARPGQMRPGQPYHGRAHPMAPGRTGLDRPPRPAPDRGAMWGGDPRRGPDVARIFAMIDTDGDGLISLAELEAAMDRMRGMRGGQPGGQSGGPRGWNR